MARVLKAGRESPKVACGWQDDIDLVGAAWPRIPISIEIPCTNLALTPHDVLGNWSEQLDETDIATA